MCWFGHSLHFCYLFDGFISFLASGLSVLLPLTAPLNACCGFMTKASKCKPRINLAWLYVFHYVLAKEKNTPCTLIFNNLSCWINSPVNPHFHDATRLGHLANVFSCQQQCPRCWKIPSHLCTVVLLLYGSSQIERLYLQQKGNMSAIVKWEESFSHRSLTVEHME